MDDLNEILYREFWVEATRANIRSLSAWLCDNVGEDGFDKLEDIKISKQDVKDLLQYIEMAKPCIPAPSTVSEQNLIRKIYLLSQKLTRKLNK